MRITSQNLISLERKPRRLVSLCIQTPPRPPDEHRHNAAAQRGVTTLFPPPPTTTACLGCSEGRREKEATCLNMFFFFSYERGCREGSNEPPMIGNKCCGLGMFSGECKSPGNQWSGPAEANVCCWLVSHGFHFWNFWEISSQRSKNLRRSLCRNICQKFGFAVVSLPESQISSCRLQYGTFIVCRTDADIGGAKFYCFKLPLHPLLLLFERKFAKQAVKTTSTTFYHTYTKHTAQCEC